MTNPADTNQASEDLFAGLDKISGYNRLLPAVKGQPEDACNVCGLSPESLKEAIQSLIRTEKLKLLAEVRERVVGEDEHLDIQSDYDKLDVPHPETDRYPGLYSVRQASRNLCRERQRTALTQLEAEL